MYIFTNAFTWEGCNTRSIFKWSLTGLNSVFLLLDWSPNQGWRTQSYYLFIAGGRIIGFIPFPRVLMLREVQSASSRIWTCVAVSISYNDNHYTMGTSHLKHMYSVLFVFTWCPMPPAICSRLCSQDSAWAGVFTRSAQSSA